jgi:hypothetical protein
MAEVNILHKRKMSWLLVAVLVFFAVAILYSALNQPGGPVTEVVGIIETVGGVPSDVGPPGMIATVRLNDGSLIQANVLPGVSAQQSQVAYVHILRRVLSGAQSYEVYRTELPK